MTVAANQTAVKVLLEAQHTPTGVSLCDTNSTRPAFRVLFCPLTLFTCSVHTHIHKFCYRDHTPIQLFEIHPYSCYRVHIPIQLFEIHPYSCCNSIPNTAIHYVGWPQNS